MQCRRGGLFVGDRPPPPCPCCGLYGTPPPAPPITSFILSILNTHMSGKTTLLACTTNRGQWGKGGGTLCPSPQRQKKMFQATLAPKLVVPECSLLVWVGG